MHILKSTQEVSSDWSNLDNQSAIIWAPCVDDVIEDEFKVDVDDGTADVMTDVTKAQNNNKHENGNDDDYYYVKNEVKSKDSNGKSHLSNNLNSKYNNNIYSGNNSNNNTNDKINKYNNNNNSNNTKNNKNVANEEASTTFLNNH